MLAYRLISGDSLLRSRSFCPSCDTTIAWYDLIPLASWLILRGKCRSCSASISPLYFFIECIAALVFSALVYTMQPDFWFAYFIFFSALLVTIRTDLEFMLISRYASVFLIPLGFFFSFTSFLPISLITSLVGALTAYLFLKLITALFFMCTKKVGMGEGDGELLAFIGSFLGITGWWISLIVGSLLGSVCGIVYMFYTQQKHSIKMPFGPFLAFGALAYVLFEKQLLAIFGF